MLTPEQRSGFVDSKYAMLEHHRWTIGKEIDADHVFVITEPDLKKPNSKVKEQICQIVFHIERDGPLPIPLSCHQVTWNAENGFGIVLPKNCWFVERLKNIHRIIEDEEHTSSFKPKSPPTSSSKNSDDKYSGWVDPDFYDDGENLPKYFHQLIGGKRKDKQNFDAAIKAYYKMFKIFSHDKSAGKVFISPITRTTLIGSPLLDTAFMSNGSPQLIFHLRLERYGYWIDVRDNPEIMEALSN